MDVAQYAGDDYAVRLHGMEPFMQGLDFLPWDRVYSYWVVPDGREPGTRVADLEHHLPGTNLHDDRPLARRVEDHFNDYGTSVKDVADKFEHTVRSASPWLHDFGTGWYQHEAGSAIQRLRRRGYSRHTAAHIIADLSPQNNWMGTPNHPELGNREEAVRYGTVVSDMVHGHGKYEGHVLPVSDSDANWARERFVSTTGVSTSKLKPGKYDIAGDPHHWDIKPEEIAELPEFHSRVGRRERTHAVETCLGIRHVDQFGAKTAAFAHNIEHPLESNRVTIDTHMTDAAVELPKAAKNRFLTAKGGVRGEAAALGQYGGTTGGYGMIGIASATLEATKRLNSKPEPNRQPMLPMHTQAIVWSDRLAGKSPTFKRHLETLQTLPWEKAFGYNFNHPQAY